MTSKQGYLKRAVVIALLAAFVSFGSCQLNKKTRQSADIGIILPLTGDLANISQEIRDGFELAARNVKGSTNIEFNFIYQDDEFKAQNSVTAANFLLNNHKIKALLGPLGPQNTLAIAPVLRQKAPDVPIVAMSMCSPAFEKEENVFCVYPSAEDQLLPIVEKIKKLDLKKVGVVTDITEPGINVADFFQEQIKDRIIDIQKIAPDERDFRTAITKLKAQNPDGIIYKATPPSLFAKQMKELDLTDIPAFALMEADEKELAKAPDAFEGHYTSAAPPISDWFNQYFMDNFGYTPSFYGRIAYDSAKTVLLAIDKFSGNISAGLKEINLDKPAMQGFRFSEDRKADRVNMTLYQIKGGEFVVAE